MGQKQLDYLSYLLRLWRANDDENGKIYWRASLKQVQTGEQVGFTSLEGLFAFLREQAGVEVDQTGDSN